MAALTKLFPAEVVAKVEAEAAWLIYRQSLLRESVVEK